jgi:outer membrane protein insertion porin family
VEAAGRNLVVRRVTPGVPSRQTDSPESGATEIPIEGRFDLNVSGAGTLDAPQGRGTIQFADLRWADYDLGRAHIAVSIGDGRARFVAEVPALQTTIEAVAALESPRQFTAAASVSHADVARLLRTNGPAGIQTAAAALTETPPPLSGAIRMHATAHGNLDQLADATVDLEVSLIDVTVSGAPIRLDREARLRYRAGAIVADDVALRIGETTLSAYGRFGTRSTTQEGLVLALKGSLADLVPLLRLAPGLDHLDAVAGSVDLVIRASGVLGAPTVNGTVSVAGASFGTADVPRVDNVAVRARFDEGFLTIDDIRASWQGATITATGEVPVTLFGDWLPDGYRQTLPALRDRARLSVALDSVTPAVLAPFVDAGTLGQIAGHFASTATIEATSLEFDRLCADMTFHRAELTMGGVPLRQVRPTQLRLANGRIEILDWIWSGGRNQINAHGHVQLDGDSPQLDVSLDGSLDLRMLGALSRDIAASGLATLDTRTRGPSSEPRIDGRIVLREGELAIRDPRVAVTDLTGTIVLTASRLQLMDVRASINGGTLQMSGEVQYPGFRLARGSIDLSGRGLALEVPAGLRSEVDADLTFAVSEETPALTGRLTVLRGSYRRPISLVGQLLSQVEVASATPVEPPGLLDRLHLSISVVSAEGIVIDNNYGRLEVVSGLKVTGPAQPALAGRLTIAEGGAVFLAGQTWRVERGIVDFTSTSRIEPDVDLALVTRVQRYDVRLSVTGTADTLEANLTSPDGLSQADAVSLLLTGRLADESTAARMDIAREHLVLLLSGELIGFAGRVVGLDSAQVGQGLGEAASDFDLLAGDTDPSARLTVSKQLRRDVEVIVSQSLRDGSDLTWIAAYRPARAIELRTTVGNNDARSYEFRHELNFGGGGRRVRPGPREPRVAPRVTTVRFAGAPGFGEGELRTLLTLDAGDRFDFYRWQQDQDRLARLYHERGYLEARIQASRGTQNTPNGEPGVALTYAIERGPVTTLSVEGASLPGDVLEQRRDAWARAVFDGFLLEDLEVMARRTLVEEGYVQAQAQADVIDSGDAAVKHVVVHVSPGARFDDRRLVFRGQEYRSADQLEEVVRTQDLSVTAWLRPTEVESALVQYYRALGYLSARVLIQEPVVTARSATRVVRIDEGPRFQVVSVDIQGVQARSDAEIRRVFGIEAPAPYKPALLESGRREVELVYLRDGYNNARVSVASLVDTEQAQIHLSLTVDEGRQQVLEAVAITGADITTRRTITRTLDLTLGQPADLSGAHRAQKRLYDTGVFQRAEIALEPIGRDAGTVTQPVRAVVTLEEAPTYRFRYGIRLGDQSGPVDVGREIRPGLVVDLLRRNLFGRTVSAGLASQLETDRRLVRGILFTPRSFGLPVTSSLFLTRSRQDLPSVGQTPVVEDALDMTLEQGFRPRTSMAVSYGYRFKRAHVFQPTAGGAVVSGFDVQVDVARLTATWAWDTRDDPFDAHTGWFHSSGVEYAAAAMGSDLRFVKYALQQYYFTPVASDVVLASAFRLGTARGFAQELIPSERFFVGGATSVRGFAEDGLGDTGVVGDPLGGNGSVIVNQEIRFPLYQWARGVGFVDAGNVFSRVSELSLFDLQVGTGVGLRINTPFGLARIDFGMPRTSRRREPFGRWYVSLGQTF